MRQCKNTFCFEIFGDTKEMLHKGLKTKKLNNFFEFQVRSVRTL